ncbi:hypothetical protein BH10ACT3_BH10ACT3_02810 [soil metagenome]
MTGAAGLKISVSMHYAVVKHEDPDKGPWKATTTGWIYHLYSSKGEKLAMYHWHPIGISPITTPHLHVPGQKCHYPTGRVLVEDVLAVAVELGAEPRDATKWRDIEERNRANFLKGATWGATGLKAQQNN